MRHPNWRWFALFNDDDGEEGAPGTGGGAASAAQRRDAGLIALKARYSGDLERAVSTLYDENYTLREKNRKLKDATDAAKLPAGAVVLDKDQAEAWAAYQKIGAPADVVAKSELDKVSSELNKASIERLSLEAAGLLGWEPKVLTDLVRDKALHIEAKDETVDGKAKRVFYTRSMNDEAAALVPLEKYADENLTPYLPALKVKRGVTWPAQDSASDSGAPSSLVDKFITERDKRAATRPSPFNPQTSTGA
jgi:hypothetical protein